jgi:hypothetical protein
MADRAHRAVLFRDPIIDKLVEVTPNARLMAGEIYLGRPALAFVTGYTGKLIVFFYLVRKGLERTS